MRSAKDQFAAWLSVSTINAGDVGKAGYGGKEVSFFLHFAKINSQYRQAYQ